MTELSEAEFQIICDDTVKAMSTHVEPFTTPISRVLSDTHGVHHGTGSYFQAGCVKFLITNEHVITSRANNPLTHKFKGNDTLFVITNPALIVKAPIDVAIARIDEKIWKENSYSAAAIPLSRFAPTHAPVQYEILFFAGFSGQLSKFFYGHLITPGSPYATQESPFPKAVKEADSKYHFSLFYPPDLARSVDGKSSLPDPHGFSGSLVWDTKRVECLQTGKEWSPDMAQVTGIVWGWPSNAVCILATKVEGLGINYLVECEAAGLPVA